MIRLCCWAKCSMHGIIRRAILTSLDRSSLEGGGTSELLRIKDMRQTEFLWRLRPPAEILFSFQGIQAAGLFLNSNSIECHIATIVASASLAGFPGHLLIAT